MRIGTLSTLLRLDFTHRDTTKMHYKVMNEGSDELVLVVLPSFLYITYYSCCRHKEVLSPLILLVSVDSSDHVWFCTFDSDCHDGQKMRDENIGR